MKSQLDKLKTLLLAIGIIIVGLVFTFIKFFNVLEPPQTGTGVVNNTTPSPSAGTVKLTVNFGNNSVISFEGNYDQNKTPLALLKNAASQNGFTVESQNSTNGPSVQSIGGIAGDDKYFWGYYVNGQMGNTASEQYQLTQGDRVEWKFEEIK